MVVVNRVVVVVLVVVTVDIFVAFIVVGPRNLNSKSGQNQGSNN